jgi:hypothetical protein
VDDHQFSYITKLKEKPNFKNKKKQKKTLIKTQEEEEISAFILDL